MSKFPKKLDEDSISRIRVSGDDCNCEGGGGSENCSQKYQIDIFDFFGVIFITHRRSFDDCDWGGQCVGGWVAKIATEKMKLTSQIFSAQFSSPIVGPLMIVMWGGEEEVCGGWVTKITTERIELTFLIFSIGIFVTQFSPSTV